MELVHSSRGFPSRVGKCDPIEIVEEVNMTASRAAAEPDWEDMLRAMARRRGCLGLECRKTPEGYCLCSRWSSWRDFSDWTGATIYMVVAAGLDSRRVAVRVLETEN